MSAERLKEGQRPTTPEGWLNYISDIRQHQQIVENIKRGVQLADEGLARALRDAQLNFFESVEERKAEMQALYARGVKLSPGQIAANRRLLDILDHPEYDRAEKTYERLLEAKRAEEEKLAAQAEVRRIAPPPTPPAEVTVFAPPREISPPPKRVEYRAEVVGGNRKVQLLYPTDRDRPAKEVVLNENQQVLLAHLALWTKLNLDKYTDPWIPGRALQTSTGWSMEKVNYTRNPLDETDLFDANKVMGYRLQAHPEDILSALSGEGQVVPVVGFENLQKRYNLVLLPAYLIETLKVIYAMLQENGRYLENAELQERTRKGRETVYNHLELLGELGFVRRGGRGRGRYRTNEFNLELVRTVLGAQDVERTIVVTVKEPPPLPPPPPTPPRRGGRPPAAPTIERPREHRLPLWKEVGEVEEFSVTERELLPVIHAVLYAKLKLIPIRDGEGRLYSVWMPDPERINPTALKNILSTLQVQPELLLRLAHLGAEKSLAAGLQLLEEKGESERDKELLKTAKNRLAWFIVGDEVPRQETDDEPVTMILELFNGALKEYNNAAHRAKEAKVPTEMEPAKPVKARDWREQVRQQRENAVREEVEGIVEELCNSNIGITDEMNANTFTTKFRTAGGHLITWRSIQTVLDKTRVKPIDLWGVLELVRIIYYLRHQQRGGVIREIEQIIQNDKKVHEWIREKYQALEAEAQAGGKPRNGKNSGK